MVRRRLYLFVATIIILRYSYRTTSPLRCAMSNLVECFPHDTVGEPARQLVSGAPELEEVVVQRYTGFRLFLIWAVAILGSWAAVVLPIYAIYCYLAH
jgi:hypothetical protein